MKRSNSHLSPTFSQETMADSSFLSDTKFQVVVESTSKHRHHPMLLPHDFVPGPKDVILGRGKATFNHSGNRRFRVVIAMNLKKYKDTKSKPEKTLIVSGIVEQMRACSPFAGGFIKKDTATGRWMSIDDDLARDKVGHALRDAFSSSKQAMKPSSMMQFAPAERRSVRRRCSDVENRLVKAQQALFRNLYQSSAPGGIETSPIVPL